MKMIIILVMFCLAPEIRAQTIELKRLEEHYVNSELSVKKKYSQYFKGEDSGYKLILYSSFAFYKEFMSSQDGENCAFHPAYQSYRGFSDKGSKSVIGWVYGGLTSVLYLGNLYGSGKAVKNYNQKQARKYEEDLVHLDF